MNECIQSKAILCQFRDFYLGWNLFGELQSLSYLFPPITWVKLFSIPRNKEHGSIFDGMWKAAERHIVIQLNLRGQP